MAQSPLSLPVARCRGVGPKTASLLSAMDITTVGDLLHHFPRAYLDRRDIRSIASLQSGCTAVIRGEITAVRCFRPSRRLNITQCIVSDESGSLKAVWFNQPYLKKTLPKGTRVILSGEVRDRRGLQMENPDVDVLSGETRDSLHTMRLVPVYPLTDGISQKQLRRLLHAATEDFIADIPENLPQPIIEQRGLISRQRALLGMHFPSAPEEIEAARRRIAFEEFLSLQLHIQNSAGSTAGAGIVHDAPAHLTGGFESRMPFSLTGAQKRAIAEIVRDMESPDQMNVLLQGDVGSGKTVVAAYSMLKAVENRRQAVLMAPTEILAEQHTACLREFLGGLDVKLALLSGGRPTLEKRDILKLLASSEPCVVVGTQALIAEKISMPNIGLVVIDEQHRFGVNQRATLRRKGVNPDLIVMTATPIPRTLALALYGSFKTISLDELPPGRQPVETRCVSESERGIMFSFVREQAACGKQVFVVCPAIGEQDGTDTRETAGAAKMHSHYTKAFSEFSVGLLHGRMRPEERLAALSKFYRNEFRILVTTTIIEVGVDVPNAAVMIVENADKFGLAQLHQLRGRVGRSRQKSYCFLLGEPMTEQAAKRLEIMASTYDGFQIAEQDMLLRGPGEFLGIAQSGIPKLRIGHLGRDFDLLEETRDIALGVLAVDPRLETFENRPLRLLVGAQEPERIHF